MRDHPRRVEPHQPPRVSHGAVSVAMALFGIDLADDEELHPIDPVPRNPATRLDGG